MNIIELEAKVRIDVRDGGPLSDRKYRNDVVEQYITDNPKADLVKLADLLLFEELTDPDEHKVAHNEYPILSEIQLARRREGKHKRTESNPKVEVPYSVASNIGADGRDHGLPTRRKRSDREDVFVNKEARSRNAERKRKYDEFTKVQPVIEKKISDIYL